MRRWQWDNTSMQRFSPAPTALLAACVVFGASLQAQQAPTPQSSSGKTQSASGAKTAEAPAAGSPSDSPLQTDKAKESYAIGMDIASTLRRQSVEVDPKVLA